MKYIRANNSNYITKARRKKICIDLDFAANF